MREDILLARGYPKNIAGDELSLKISSYPATATYLANRLRGKGSVACELCCGVGISLIELAKTFQHVIGVDNDETILQNCKTNLDAAMAHNYTLISGDIGSLTVLKEIHADIVLYDIPYWSNHHGKVHADSQNPDLKSLVDSVRKHITSNIVIYTPPHFRYEDLRKLVGKCEYAQIYIHGKHDRNFVFLGSLAEHIGPRTIEL